MQLHCLLFEISNLRLNAKIVVRAILLFFVFQSSSAVKLFLTAGPSEDFETNRGEKMRN